RGRAACSRRPSYDSRAPAANVVRLPAGEAPTAARAARERAREAPGADLDARAHECRRGVAEVGGADDDADAVAASAHGPERYAGAAAPIAERGAGAGRAGRGRRIDDDAGAEGEAGARNGRRRV